MFRIPFSGLALGHHALKFRVNDAFLETFAYDELFDCKIDVEIDLERTERFLKLDFHFSGTCFVSCDRCLDALEVPIDSEESLIVNFGNDNDFESEVWTISSKEHELNLDNFVYETLVLLRPFSVMHAIENCNPKMIAKLQAPALSASEEDPRWDALKVLKDKL